ncbi:MAG: Hsp20/alpha crystallin family protein [Candidatus Altiarchaeota archaeon]
MIDYGGDFSEIHAKIRQMFEEARSKGRCQEYQAPLVYGFTMRFTGEGRPVAEEFGNVSPFGIAGYMEPVTDVIEKYDSVAVVIELPGIGKEDIDLRTTPESVYIKVDTPFRKFVKDVRLSAKVKPETAIAKYNNGVLEVTLKRADDAPAGRRVQIQ